MTAAEPADRAWAPVLVAFAVAVLGAVPQFLLGALSPLITAEGHLDLIAVATAILVMNGAAAVASPTMGGLLARVGTTWGIRALVGLSALGGTALALGVPGRAGLLGVATLFGLSLAMSQPLANSILMARVAPHRHGLAFGLKQAATPAAGLLAGLSLPAASALLGWRACFGALAVTCALGLAASARSGHGGRPVRPRREQRGSDPRGWPRGSWPRLLMWTGAAGLGSAAFVSTATYVVSLAVSAGASLASAGLLLTLVSAASVVGRIGAGIVVDRRRIDSLRLVEVLMLAGGACVAALLVARAAPAGFVVLAVLMGLSAWSWNGLFHHGVATSFRERALQATGQTQVGLFGGAAVGPLLFAVVAERTTAEFAWLGCGLALAFAAGLIRVGRVLGPR